MHSNYHFNYFVLNPAATGAQKHFELNTSMKIEFFRFRNDPATYTLSGHGPLGQRKLTGLGAVLVYDWDGPQKLFSSQVSYAHHFSLGRGKLSLGLATRFFHDNNGRIAAALLPGSGVEISGESLMDFSLGAMFSLSGGHLGVSVQNMACICDWRTYRTGLQIYITASQQFRISRLLIIEPAGLLNFNRKHGLEGYEINVLTHLVNYKFILGTTHRGGNYYNRAFAIIGGVNIEKWVQLRYSYDVSEVDIQQYTRRTHEISMGIKLGGQRKAKGPGLKTNFL